MVLESDELDELEQMESVSYSRSLHRQIHSLNSVGNSMIETEMTLIDGR